MKYLFWGAALALVACGPTVTNPGDDDGGAGIDASGTIDNDGDGYPQSVDCNDDDPAIHPGAPENCTDGIDNDCNGAIDANDLECLPPCERAAREQSYFGCTFYAADLPQFSTNKIFGISLSNPSNVDTANVTLTTSTGVLATLAVPPRGVATYEDPPPRTINIPGAGIHTLAVKIESDLPVAAYQFNSLDTISAASTDASMLFAEHNLARLYYVMDYQARAANDSFVAIYATKPNTSVQVVAPVAVTGATTATLQPYQVMVVTAASANTSLTGTQIIASEDVGVFGGNACANVPYGMSYCDHLEQQIFPRQAIGTRYVVGKSHARVSCTPPDYLRIMADQDGTVVNLSPAPEAPNPSTLTLEAGQWVELTITQSTEIASNKPVLVGQFLRSSNDSECSSEGDPAFMLQVPVDQFRTDYIFLTPPTYQTDYVDIIAPVGAIVTLDGTTVPLSTTPIAGTNFTLTSVVVQDGGHVLLSNQPVGVMVYGFGGPSGTGTVNVSYGYPAGLNLKPINPVE